MIEINKLCVSYYMKNNHISILDDLSISLPVGSILGISGPSGTGKTTFIHAIMGILPDNAECGGTIVYKNTRYSLKKGAAEGLIKDLMFVPQHVLDSVSQIHKIGSIYLDIALAKNKKQNVKILQEKFEHYLVELGIAPNVFNLYPFQLSGGMLQRVLIAIGLSVGSKIIILDEPTSALDVGNREVIISTLKRINQIYKTTILIISHDDEVINELATHRLLMMKGGYKVE